MKVFIEIVIVLYLSVHVESLFSSTLLQDDSPDIYPGSGYHNKDSPHTDEHHVNDEDYPADQARGKKLEHPYIYNRRQVLDRLMYTSEVVIKQGRLKGIVRKMQPQSGLSDVDQFLGLPYAESPTGNRRFMPPGAPPPWHGLKLASHLPPVCPQKLPNMGEARVTMSKGRYEQLEKIVPYLKNESEDCLYLNLYVPKWVGDGPKPKFPVIVFIHGESFEWNSGNPYDGSVLASYGQVIVVTLNYRLGILGFMRPSVSEHTVSNFGLLDQIAALQWVKDNIGSFGGDNHIVTLMGHSTGAACVNLLMVSPVAKGLFHRAILMSGSAMSDWAITNQSLALTMQVLHGLNCPFHDANDEILMCLKKKRYQDIIKVPTSTPEFSTSFGPVVDGLVIPNQPYKVMGQYTDLFSRYDLLFGVTEVESYHILHRMELQDGIREARRDELLRLYMQNRFEIRPDLALAATLKKYTDIYNNPIKASSQEHRDVVLDILSDARVVAPLMQTGVFHAKVNPRSYMYVFGHNSEAGDYANLPYSIVGEEVAFVFGAPLAASGPFHSFYSIPERLFSEAVMLYWTNFAKTGNPKAPWRERFINLHPLEWQRYDIDWPEFNARNQSYVNLGVPPSLGYKYRNVYMNYWNKELPDEINQIATMQPVPPFVHLFPPSSTQLPRSGTSIDAGLVITGHMNRYPVKHFEHTTEDPYRTLKVLLKDPHDTSGMYNAQPTFGGATDSRKVLTNENIPEEEVVRGDSITHILIGIVVTFLVLNAIVITTYVVRRNRKNKRINHKLNILSYDGSNDDDLKRTKNIPDGDESYVLDIVRKSSSFTTPKSTKHSPINGFKVTRQLSTSTVDTHTKVSDWISHDKFENKASKKSLSPFTFRGKSLLKKPKKISIGIDATPQNRSDSVLRQEPIELTKQKTIDSGRSIIICQEVDIDADLINPESDTPSTSDSSTAGSTASETHELPMQICHQHSRSDPVQMYYTIHRNDEQVTSFIENGDINVTSRDKSVEKDPLTAEEQLQNIKRRNFPKVLPDYPDGSENVSLAMKRRSLPAPNFSFTHFPRVPPAPPPRTISTLGRSESQKRLSRSLMGTSQGTLLEVNSEDEEPIISQNTLIVGPLLPKNQESLYLTIKPKKQDSTDTPKGSLHSLQHSESAKSLRTSGIKPPSTSSITSLATTFQKGPKMTYSHSMPESPKLEQKVVFKPNNTVKTTLKANIPGIHTSKDNMSRIPHLRTIPSSPSTTSSSSSNSTSDREKSSTADSSGSSETSSSTGTVRRVQDLKH